MMNIESWLQSATVKLEDSSVPTAKLDAEVLLADLLEKDRSWLHAHPEELLREPDISKLNNQIARRMNHEPLAYIRGKSEFYGREFMVTPDTLQPRPETETIIDIVRELAPLKIIDIGTGSGCIAVTLKLELPASDVFASDVSDACIEVAKKNAKILKSDVAIIKSDLLIDINVSKLQESVLVCNLPYVPAKFNINESARHEPDLAIFGGDDGLEYYRQLFEQIISLPPQFKPEIVITEGLPTQHQAMALIAKQADFALDKTDDFIQQFVRSF